MRRSIIYLIALVCIAGAAQAQSWTFGPGDTVKLPLELMDSINNPAAVDSSADSVLIRVVKNFAANATGADTCYLHRGLMDASTNTLLHTTGNATTTLGFGSVPKRVQTFSFFATAYTLTGSATASGTYTIIVYTYDASLGLITTRKYPFNYIYYGASTGTYAMWADSVGAMARWAMKTVAPDSTSAGLVSVNVGAMTNDVVTAAAINADAIGASELATDAIGAAEIAASAITSSEAPNLDSATSKVGVGDGAIGAAEIATDAIGAPELAATAVSEMWNHRIDTVAADSSAGKVLYKAKAIKDTTSTQLNATISSRGTSTLTTTDNIGINWADVANPTTTLGLTGTTVGTATNISQIGGTAQSSGMNLATYLPAVFDTALFVQGFRVNAKTKLGVSANTDTLHVYWSTTELFKVIYYHIGGAAGDPPDSTKTVAP